MEDNCGQLGRMNLLAKTGFCRQRQERKALHELNQAAQIAVSIRTRFAIDESRTQNITVYYYVLTCFNWLYFRNHKIG